MGVPKDNVQFNAQLAIHFMTTSVALKHPGFKEENEWRVIYNPEYYKSNVIKEEIVPIHHSDWCKPVREKKISDAINAA